MQSENNDLTEDQQGFVDFIESLTEKELLSTYKSYRFLAEFGRVDEVWKRDACRRAIIERFGHRAIPREPAPLKWMHFDLPSIM